MRKIGLAATALALAGALASCSDEEPGVPSNETPLPPPTGASSGTATPGLPHSGAPKVVSPIADTSRWEGDPCIMISSQQIESVGLAATEPQREDQPTGPG